MYTYDPSNIFARILRGEIPNKTVMESAHTLVFHDINPAAPLHCLVIPKGPYVNFDDFAAAASAEEIVDFHRTAAAVCVLLGIAPGDGYRGIVNTGVNGMQEVPHYHMHILAGRALGRLVERE